MGRLENKIALVTGAARGQGRSHALRFAEEGADIIAVDSCAEVPGLQYPAATVADLAQTVSMVEQRGRRVVGAQVDIRDKDQLAADVAGGVAELGGLDIAIANAGISIIAPWDRVTAEIWNTTIAVNCTWHTVLAAAPHLVTRGGGSIVLVSSVAGLKGVPFLTPYVASKHGITGLARAFAHELAKDEIRVNSLHPTGVATPMGEAGARAALRDALGGNPRLGPMFTNSLSIDVTTPLDVSNAALFLASDEARHVTGLAMTVDAGNSQF